jgi:hypothetical protein
MQMQTRSHYGPQGSRLGLTLVALFYALSVSVLQPVHVVDEAGTSHAHASGLVVEAAAASAGEVPSPGPDQNQDQDLDLDCLICQLSSTKGVAIPAASGLLASLPHEVASGETTLRETASIHTPPRARAPPIG